MDHQHRCWSDLPTELLALISGHLRLADHIRLSAVCKSFRRAAAESSHSALHLPWLALPPRPPSSTTSTWTLFSPIESHLNFPFNPPLPPLVHSLRCIGSSLGWLAFALTDDDRHHPFLFNPITTRSIFLPHLPRSIGFLFKASFSAAAAGCVTFVSMISLSDFVFVCCRFDDAQPPPPPAFEIYSCGNHIVYDIIFLKGLLYCLTSDYHVLVFEFCPRPVCRNAYKSIKRIVVQKECSTYEQKPYLVESGGGELLIVILNLSEGSTICIRVYRFVADPSRLQVKEVKDLGNEMLFLGESSSSVGFAGKDFERYGFRRNCIYFMEKVWRVFSLEDQIVRPFDARSSCPAMFSPHWFMLNA